MGPKTKYFVFNKELDFRRCMLQAMDYRDGRLALVWQKEASNVLISRILDSQEAGMEWHQMKLELENQGNMAFEISVFAADSLIRKEDGREQSLEYSIKSEELSIEEKKGLFAPYLQKRVINQEDFLLHEIKGRYLWFLLEAVPQPGQSLYIDRIILYFPRKTWLSYLPEIYEKDDRDQFLERFLAVFQTMHEEMNRRISGMPCQIDVDDADQDFLEWMSGWLGIAENYMWTQDQLRRLLQKGTALYKIRGTRQAVLEIVRLYLHGAPVYLVENFQLDDISGESAGQLAEQLYGKDPYRFQVIVREQDVPTAREYQTVLKIIREVKPAYMDTELIVLRPYIFLNQYTYLGLNSILGEYKNASLDGKAMLSFTVLGENTIRLGNSREENE